jgi:DeoR/GlpR family transcriptional regulator of sugar metabolism
MLKEERIQKIRDILLDVGSVNVQDLKDQFAVSAMTIRRDLKVLENKGVIERVHGGAILAARKHHHPKEPPIIDRMNIKAEEKKTIAVYAASLIEKGETVFLGSGTTTLYLARELIIRDDITIATNSVPILHELANNSNMKIITVGGFLRRSELSMIGAFAEPVLDNIRVNKVFIGMRGIHPIYGFTSDHPEELTTDKKILNISDNIIIVADHTKIGHVATNRVAPVEEASLIITSKKARSDLVEVIRDRGISVRTV